MTTIYSAIRMFLQRGSTFLCLYSQWRASHYNIHQTISNLNIQQWVRARLCKLHKRVHSTRSRSDNAYQLLAHGRWFSPGTPASSTTKTGHHDIVEILLKAVLNTNQIKLNQINIQQVLSTSYIHLNNLI